MIIREFIEDQPKKTFGVGDQLRKIQQDYALYRIELAEAEEKAAPLLKQINDRQRELAKKYHRRPKDFTFFTFK